VVKRDKKEEKSFVHCPAWESLKKLNTIAESHCSLVINQDKKDPLFTANLGKL
jgi:hypothetical protein